MPEMENMTENDIAFLGAKEQAALNSLVVQLDQRYGEDLLRVILYGSKARGDSDEESDIDLLVVVRIPESEFWTHRAQLIDLTTTLDLEYGVVLSALLVTAQEFAEMRQANLLFHRNLRNDGVDLWMPKPDVPMLVTA